MIKHRSEAKHMGLMLTSDPKLEFETYKKRADDLKSVTFAARSLGSKSVPAVPSVLDKIYESVALPKCLYGFEVVPINSKGLEEIEKAHRGMSKLVQNLPTNTPNASHLALVGWHTLDYRIAVMKLCFLWRILCLPVNNIYRRIISFFLELCLNDDDFVNDKSPTYSIYTYVKRFNMIDTLVNSLYSDNQGKISHYKKLVKKTVFDYEKFCWKVTMNLLHNLPFYDSCVLNITMHPWWCFVKASPRYYRKVSSILAIICGSQPKFHQCNFDNNLCGLCCDRQAETPVHILFQCPCLNIDRDYYLSRVRFSMPFALRNEFINMTDREKCQFLLSAMNTKFNADWLSIYESISDFVHELYRKRKKLYMA